MSATKKGVTHRTEPTRRLALNPRPKRRCLVCGGSLDGLYLRAKTCGDVCRKRLSRRRGHQEQKAWHR